MERLSALMDGELDPEHVAQSLEKAHQDEAWRNNWEIYHVIGECLRKDMQMPCNVSATVMMRLANEPTVLAPRKMLASYFPARIAWALAASAAGIAWVAWIAFTQNPLFPPPTVATVAPAAVAAKSALKENSMRSVSSSEYLTAHQQVSPSSVVRGVAAYVATVSANEGEAERR